MPVTPVLVKSHCPKAAAFTALSPSPITLQYTTPELSILIAPWGSLVATIPMPPIILVTASRGCHSVVLRVLLHPRYCPGPGSLPKESLRLVMVADARLADSFACML